MITKEFSRYLKLHEITICKDIKGSGLNIQPLTMLDVDGLLPKRVFETRISRILAAGKSARPYSPGFYLLKDGITLEVKPYRKSAEEPSLPQGIG
jgi:hypothetical protein